MPRLLDTLTLGIGLDGKKLKNKHVLDWIQRLRSICPVVLASSIKFCRLLSLLK